MERHGIVILDCYGTQANSQKTMIILFICIHKIPLKDGT